MSWNQDNQGPWGNKGGNRWQGKSSGPNDFEDFIRKAQSQFKDNIPKGFQNFTGFGVIALIAIVVWLGSGFYTVKEDEQAVVMRFGKYVRTTGPGLNWHYPYPIEKELTISVSDVRLIDSKSSASPIQVAVGTLRQAADQPNMLTGDENIADVRFTVQWFIKDLSQYVFKAKDPDITVKIAAESIIREIVAQTPIADILTSGRGVINLRAQEMLQKLVDEYQLGIQIKEVSLQDVDPPLPVRDAFLKVQAAKAQKEQKINEAYAYRNSIVPTAEGDAIKITQNAEAYKAEKVARATGEAGRFKSVLDEYRKAPQTTATRLKLETTQKILTDKPKVYFDSDSKALQNVLPHMALPAIDPAKSTREGEKQ